MVVLIDGCNYLFYRIGATFAWWAHQRDQEPPSLDNSQFVETLINQSLSHLNKLSKKIAVPLKQMDLICDCPRTEIWRHQFTSGYKGTRTTNQSLGPYIEPLFQRLQNQFRRIWRIENAECDDVIAILTQFWTDLGQSVTIISSDSDFQQLLVNPLVRIYQPKNWTPVTVTDAQAKLDQKIIKGDRSDNVSKLGPGYNRWQQILNAQMIDFSYIPRWIQDRVIQELLLLLAHQRDGVSSIPAYYQPASIRRSQAPVIQVNPHYECRPHWQQIAALGSQLGQARLQEISQQNLTDLWQVIEWNAHHGITCYRLPSQLFPHYSNSMVRGYVGLMGPVDVSFASDWLIRIGQLARRYRQRLFFQAGSFNILGQFSEIAFQQTSLDLDYLATVLDLLGCDQDGVIVIQSGLFMGPKEKAITNWINNFHRLSDRAQHRLTLRNDRHFSVNDCLDICEQLNIPLVYDHSVPESKPEHDWTRIWLTWNRRQITPLFYFRTPDQNIEWLDKLVKEHRQPCLDIMGGAPTGASGAP